MTKSDIVIFREFIYNYCINKIETMDIEIHIHIPDQRRDIEESAGDLPQVIEKFIEDVIQAVVRIHDNVAREALVKPISRTTGEIGPWMSLEDKHFPQSDNRLTEIICNNMLIGCIYLRRDEFNYVETTFFVYHKNFDKLREAWLEKKK